MNAPLWTCQDFITSIKGRLIGNAPATIDGISIDSRSLEPGDAFFAIRGDRFDGHDFAPAAAQAGASVLVIDRSHEDKLRALNVPLIVVPDVLAALETLGRAARARSQARIIAVTGSVGKTTTKEALRHILSRAGVVHASPASFNNHWGVPLTLARLPQATDFAIFEIGMNHVGEIRPLAKMVRPHIALITCVASVHSAYFASIEEIAQAKAEIFEGLKNGGVALLNCDDAQFDFLSTLAHKAGTKNIRSFGHNAQADYRLIDIKQGDGHSDCQFSLRGQERQARLGTAGQHMAMNILSCLGVSDILQLDLSKILTHLADFSAPSGRGARHILRLLDGQKCLLLDESYNANPTSMRAALRVLGETKPAGQGRRIAVLGDMLELGKESQQAHADLAQPLAAAGVNMVFLLGQEMRVLAHLLEKTGKEVIWRAHWQELEPLVLSQLQAGDVISIKSSKSTGASHIVTALLKHYKG